jgi:alpha-glucoside transport system substrate-binding protein
MSALARAGILKDVSSAIDLGAYKAVTAPTFVELGTVENRLVGVFIRASVKGLVWYDPHVLGAVMPGTWDDLQRLIDRTTGPDTRTWCLGLASAESSGWPGTDWIEDFLLRQSGPVVYDEWVAGNQAWTSPEVRRAFEAYGAVAAAPSVYGGPAAAVSTEFSEAGNPLFTSPPGCLFLHQGSFMQAFFEAAGMSAGSDFDFFPFPSLGTPYDGSVIGGGDLFGLITDRPAARALLRYLVGPEAQGIWVSQGGTLSVNQGVKDYPDPVSARAAELLRQAARFRFDASDLMPSEMTAAFLSGVLAFTADQRQLDQVLTELDGVRRTAYRS